MRECKINEQQVNYLLSVLGEYKAKEVLQAVHLLSNLPTITSMSTEPLNTTLDDKKK